ncbi:MAG TPA: Ig-like domain-containing protein, partial [Kofleriaceae bacterium]|nr:Ig-like domain-containing protein [Kofleriaceae bacterium]
IELVESTSGMEVPATLYAGGIHVSIDPLADLVAGTQYQLRIGGALADLGGQAATPTTFAFTPQRSHATPALVQTLRTRAAGDPGPASAHAGGDHNAIAIESALIGAQSVEVLPSALEVELGDPALGGPLAFTIRRGQRLRARALDVKLGGELPAGLSTGDIVIELLTDADGQIRRNPRQPATLRPDNERAPLLADLALDLAVYSVDAAGNAALTQTVLGVQGSGVVVATDGVLDLEAVLSIDLDLLGVTRAATNLVLEMISDAAAAPDTDRTAPVLLAALPSGTADPLSADTAVELLFSEPVDLDQARAGGVRLETAAGAPIASVLESHGAALAIRPLAPLPSNASLRVALTDVADLAGNRLPATAAPAFSTPVRLATTTPLTVVSVHPGAPCALTGGGDTTPGHCLTSGSPDDNYPVFSLAANDAIDVRFTQAPAPTSVTRAAACDRGSVRIEEIDGGGACLQPVAGTLRVRDRALSFVPDTPWRVGQRYRLTLVSGVDASCGADEICGQNGVAASFSSLHRDAMGALLRSNLVIDFTGAAPSAAARTTMETAPVADANGSGTLEAGELAAVDNRVALRITGTTGVVTAARFPVPDCVPATAEPDACMAVSGAIPIELLPLARNCALPGGATAASCIPVALSPQLMLATSLPLDATAVIGASTITINTITGPLVLRVREPAGGTVTGYIIDSGTPTLVLSLDVYLDAPDMQLPLLGHDLHAKPLTIALRGPLRFLADGRIAIAVSNLADVPLTVNISGGGVVGAVQMLIPRGELKLQLTSPPLRGGDR